MKMQLNIDPYYGEHIGVVDAFRRLIHELRASRPWDVKDAYFVAHPDVVTELAKHAYESQSWPPAPPPGLDEPMVVDCTGHLVRPKRGPDGRVVAPESFADEIRDRYVSRILGMDLHVTDRVPKHLVELWIENDVDRAIRRGIEQFGEARIVVANARDFMIKDPIPDPTLRVLVSHWRGKARSWVHGIVAKTRRQV